MKSNKKQVLKWCDRIVLVGVVAMVLKSGVVGYFFQGTYLNYWSLFLALVAIVFYLRWYRPLIKKTKSIVPPIATLRKKHGIAPKHKPESKPKHRPSTRAIKKGLKKRVRKLVK